tara:strand:+ start:318 stop:458 length:141 start_codon:yes stop_codon:yes gene_type:complete
MIPDFLQPPDSFGQIGLIKLIVGVLIVLFASFVGVEIRLEKEEEEP